LSVDTKACSINLPPSFIGYSSQVMRLGAQNDRCTSQNMVAPGRGLFEWCVPMVMNNSTHEFERLLGKAALALWPDLPRDVQENLFETAVAGEVITRNHLASYLHDHHPKTAHPAKPTQLV
jgi:hypothetical protein